MGLAGSDWPTVPCRKNPRLKTPPNTESRLHMKYTILGIDNFWYDPDTKKPRPQEEIGQWRPSTCVEMWEQDTADGIFQIKLSRYPSFFCRAYYLHDLRICFDPRPDHFTLIRLRPQLNRCRFSVGGDLSHVGSLDFLFRCIILVNTYSVGPTRDRILGVSHSGKSIMQSCRNLKSLRKRNNFTKDWGSPVVRQRGVLRWLRERAMHESA
jgi:hypothetical protein